MVTGEYEILVMGPPYLGNVNCFPDKKAHFSTLPLLFTISLRKSWVGKTIRNFLASETNTLILETKLLEGIRQTFNFDPKNVKSSLFLLLALIGIERVDFDYPYAIPAWGYVEPAQRRILETGIKRLDDFLTRETSLPYFEFDILVHINKGLRKSEKVTLALLPWLIDLCVSVERREDSSIWGKFECLKGRGNQVERLLFESGCPMGVAEIAREINHRVVPLGHHRVVETNLSNQIGGDGRFVPIGRSGKWGLKSWEHIDTKSIQTLMEQYLITRNEPATVDEIYAYVSERRPASKNSISMYLVTGKETFARISRTTWGLAKWSDATRAEVWDMEQVADFVATLFKRSKSKELDYKVIKEALMKEAGISAKQAQGLLNLNPVIKTQSEKHWGERRAIFQPNYKQALTQAKTNFRSGRVSLRQQVEETVRGILETVPDQQMPMAELIRELHKRLDRPYTTLYQYVGMMSSIERIDDPNLHTKICRLRNIKVSIQSRALRQRVVESVRAILETAPNRQITLAELIQRLQKEYSCPKATLYQYIAHLDFVERITVSNSSTKICRLREAQEVLIFPQVQNIVNPILREKIGRAVLFLNEENVDIGLFLLSKEFEATLKAYLIAADAKGELKTHPPGKMPDKWNLNGMVECARENRIITDHAVFHYLRQARNDRAHGTMPSLEERRLLMNSAQYLAGLYIDYIKLLDALSFSF